MLEVGETAEGSASTHWDGVFVVSLSGSALGSRSQTTVVGEHELLFHPVTPVKNIVLCPF